jgi:mono/diheme cytochrome c family protein
MTTDRTIRAALFAACALGAGTARAAPPDLPARVREVFAAKCAQCHGPDLPRPKKFGYVTDLVKLADNPRLVVPFRPDESRLWLRVSEDEMPPEGARAGALSAAEKGVIHDWIAAGAPSDPPPDEAKEEPPRPIVPRLLGWLGRFHVLVVHFPIGLLTAAALGEAWCLVRRRRQPWAPVRFCVLLGAVSAAAAAGLGWLRAATGAFGGSELISWHRWAGTGAATLALAALLLSEADTRRGSRSLLLRVMLFADALLVGLAGHLGGGLVHGEDFLKW